MNEMEDQKKKKSSHRLWGSWWIIILGNRIDLRNIVLLPFEAIHDVINKLLLLLFYIKWLRLYFNLTQKLQVILSHSNEMILNSLKTFIFLLKYYWGLSFCTFSALNKLIFHGCKCLLDVIESLNSSWLFFNKSLLNGCRGLCSDCLSLHFKINSSKLKFSISE